MGDAPFKVSLFCLKLDKFVLCSSKLTRKITPRPTRRNSFHNMKNYDFNALLKTKCIANGWDLPIIIYGRVFQLSCVQYVAVILRHNGRVHVCFVEICITALSDVQSRICETVISQILVTGTLPELNLVIKVKQDLMTLGMFRKNFVCFFL